MKKVAITTIFISLALIHLVNPDINFDIYFVVLLVIAVLPWIDNYSIEWLGIKFIKENEGASEIKYISNKSIK